MIAKSFGLRLRTIAVASLIALVGITALPGLPFKAVAEKSIADLWQLTQGPPKIGDAERLAELSARRAEVVKRMGNDSLMVLFSAQPRVYTGDVDYQYRQENNLYYLTGIKQADVVLLLIPVTNGAAKEILFMPERNPALETWSGRMMSFEEASARSGIKDVRNLRLLRPLLACLAPRAERALANRRPLPQVAEQQKSEWKEEFHNLIEAATADRAELYLLIPNGFDLREYMPEHELASDIMVSPAGFKVRNAHPIFAELRLTKSEWELKLLQHAVDITSEAFSRVFAAAAPGMYEYEIQAEFEYTFRRRNADYWGYPCIVGAGRNATTLHYETNQDRLDDGGLLLMDCAAEYDHYSADITRTVPINGKFTKEQADIYNIVYQAQAASIKAVRPGNHVNGRQDPNLSEPSVHERSVEVIKEGLLRLGLITSKNNDE
ncbi:MAG: aminopeptidase P N-terminal domain-containing protein, partial [Blastocatellia bacterium]|nr:aminopeptidase P N-terminal domain-containing protein [Blastocatellia bacterium]